MGGKVRAGLQVSFQVVRVSNDASESNYMEHLEQNFEDLKVYLASTTLCLWKKDICFDLKLFLLWATSCFTIPLGPKAQSLLMFF